MGCQDDLTHNVSGINRIGDIHSQVTDKPCHGRQSLGMNAVLRFFYTYQTIGFRIFGQHRERKKPQRAVRNRIRRELLTAGFGHRKRQQLTNIVAYDVDAIHGHEFSQPRRYSCDNVTVSTIHLLEPIQGGGKMRPVVGDDRRISSETIRPTHGAWLER